MSTPLQQLGYGGLTLGRTDQGVDFGGSGPVRALGDGTVKSVGGWHGWPSATGDGIVYTTGGRNIFVMEGFKTASGLRAGSKVKAGQILGQVVPGTSTGIESGFANAAGTAPLVQYNGLPDGTPTAGGKAFLAFLKGTTSATPAAAAPASSGSGSGVLGTGIGPNLGPDLNPVDAVKGALNGIWDSIKSQAAYAGLATVVILGGFALLGLGLLHATHSRPTGAT